MRIEPCSIPISCSFCGVGCGLVMEVAARGCRIGLDAADLHLAIERYHELREASLEPGWPRARVTC